MDDAADVAARPPGKARVSVVDKTVWARLSPLLDEFLDLPEPEHAARLAQVRAEDPALADALAEMLGREQAIEEAGFLEAPAVPRPAGLEGQAVGAYTLVRELGHGGMGTVWLARRTDGRYQGEVAIKFLRSGLFGHGDAGRFEREGSILARLSHPNIARLLDAGVTPDGTQPYLVLEYIDGEPVDAYCNRLALPVPARLRLFLDVLGAVAHAHNRLILHRDLKPSNILVTASGEVKLLDFGIAKLLDDTAAGASAVTAHAGNAFTPDFAAPEQLQGGDVTTATDVYALGVLMYVLLGGEHPTTSPTGAPLDRMRAVIEVEPKRLSESVLRRGGPRSRHSAASRKLAAELSGDVDTIAAKALKKSPAERYANAADLADDVRRYLAHEPIAARPDARLYRVAKFVRRHRAGVATASLAVLALAAGVGVALWQAREASRQREQAEGLVEFMIKDLRKKLEPVGRLDVLDSVGDRALAYYAAQDLDRLDADSLGRRARALHLIGDLAQQRGRLDEAERDFRQAADTTAALLKRHPGDTQRIFDHAQSEYWVGYTQWTRGRFTDAEASFRRYLALADRLVAIAPANLDWQLEQVYAATNVATTLIDLGRPAEALATIAPAERNMADIARARPDEAFDHATIIGWLMRAQESLGRYDDAIASVQRKMAAARRAPNADTNASVRQVLGTALVDIGRLQMDLGHRDEALATLRAGVAEAEALVARDPSNLDWLFDAMRTQQQLEDLQLAMGDVDDARALDRRVADESTKLLSTPRGKAGWRIALLGHGRLLEARLARDDAERATVVAALRDYLADVRRYELAGSQLTPGESELVARAGLALGDLLQHAGKRDEAVVAWHEAFARNAPAAARAGPPAMTLQGLLCLRLGQAQEARAWADRVLATSYRHPVFADLEDQLGPARMAGETPGPSQGNP
ncbi:MAG: protein kinase domain-containing protein [Burkholderiaceae bacterium]